MDNTIPQAEMDFQVTEKGKLNKGQIFHKRNLAVSWDIDVPVKH